jgi:hypothetical protein
MASYRAPKDWEDWIEWLTAGLQGQSQWKLAPLLIGMLFAGGRRVVASWIRTAGLSDDYQVYYYFLQSVGKRWPELGRRVLVLVLRRVLQNLQRVVVGIDDSPTKRYGPKVEGAGIHHDPTPGPTGHPFLYGHIWVTLSVILRHARWGTIGLPIWSWLYVRQQDVSKIARRHGWVFQTKLKLAADLVLMAVETLYSAGKEVWVVVDGAYAKRPFVQPVLALGVTLVGRLRKDSALRDLPPKEKTKRRGRKRKYGKNRISLAKRAANRHGWQDVTCLVYGVEVVKRVKTFLATHRTFGGAIRVVIVKEQSGPHFFYCTDTRASVREIVETFADRGAIEQDFHDVKEVWGSGQQQVRNLWSNIGVWHLNLWMHTLVELWAWRKTDKQLTRRDDSPWDDAQRRPSHADRRKALQAACLAEEFSRRAGRATLPRKFRTLLKRLLRIAV